MSNEEKNDIDSILHEAVGHGRAAEAKMAEAQAKLARDGRWDDKRSLDSCVAKFGNVMGEFEIRIGILNSEGVEGPERILVVSA